MAPTLAIALLSLFSFVIVRSLQKKRDTKGFPLPPGPPPLPFVGNVVGIDTDHPWLAYSRWGNEYGEIVYSRLFSQDIVIINSERVAHDLLARRSHNYSTRPPGLMHVLDFFGSEFASVFLPYSDRWRLHRRIYHQAFRLEAAPAFRPIQMRNARNLVSNLLASPEAYGAHLHTFSTSIIMSIVYDYSTAPRDDPFVAAVEQALEISIRELRPEVAAVVSEFPILEKLPPWFPGASFVRGAILLKTLIPTTVDLPFEHVKKNMAAGTAAPSMVSDALRRIPEKTSEEKEAAVLEKAIKEASASGYAAASETTTSTLYVFLLAMVLYPEVQARAQAEIDSVIGETLERLPDWDDRASMPYVNAVIQETLRWFPVVPLGIPHATVNDDVYEGYYIPKGATVMANTWSMARNPEKYPNPTKFVPERHMSKVSVEAPSAHGPDISFAFGFGRRVCVGRHVADASLFAAVVNILAVFRVERALGWNVGPDAEGVKWTGGVTTHPVFPCIFTPRHTEERASQLIKAQC
ncbi:cytochrome P450 [Suillus clintonianus]|uniref:cytochrome P450 n=1 Tax=Suillus clintonianus TaxID=1904413 RepID=UPI001B882A83|nr:cytochrome P450 [Suillus clintonianus]KAG2136036.1 cytochrome P450 [Suillus clintonianus]